MKRIRLKPCNDLDGASRQDNAEKLGTLEKKDETIGTENLVNLRNKELITWMKEE